MMLACQSLKSAQSAHSKLGECTPYIQQDLLTSQGQSIKLGIFCSTVGFDMQHGQEEAVEQVTQDEPVNP